MFIAYLFKSLLNHFCFLITLIYSNQAIIRHKNYKNQPPQKIATLPFIKFNRTYEYTDTISPSESPCISYSVYLYGIYEGTLVKSHPSTGGELIPKLNKIELHVESRNNESAKLFWNRQENVSNYKVYRSSSDQNEEDFTPIVILAGDARRYTDRNVNFEKTYTYFVQAIYVQDETQGFISL